MKKVYVVILMFLSIIITAGCESRHETAGDLAGMWQMTQWISNDNDTIPADGIYYSFQLELMKVQQLEKGGYMGENFFLMYYTRTSDSLLIGKMYARPDDKLIPSDSLQYIGVPKEGGYRIVKLNDEKMILNSSLGTMRFRKY